MGEMGRLGGEREIKELNSEIWGNGVCDIWEKCVVWVEEYKAPKKEFNSEIWGNGVCDIWEKWVVET